MSALCPSKRAVALWAILLAAFCTQLKADFISIPGIIDPANADHGPQIFIRLRINDRNGDPMDVNALVDPGDNGRLDFSAGDGARLGLPQNVVTTVDGAGGEADQTESFVNGSRNPSVTGETDSNPNFRTNLAGSATISSSNTTTVGTEFFNFDPAGPGEIDLDYVGGTVTIYNHAQAVQHSFERFFKTQLLISPPGDYDSDPNGTAYAVNVEVGSTFSAFVISPGVGRTLISPGFASSLGITCSGQPMTFSSELGVFTVPSATVSLDLFSAQPSQTFQVGCLSSMQDPLNENFLGSDFLGQYNSIYVDAATSTFAASPVPEPATLLTVCACLVTLATIGICGRNSRRSQRQTNVRE